MVNIQLRKRLTKKTCQAFIRRKMVPRIKPQLVIRTGAFQRFRVQFLQEAADIKYATKQKLICLSKSYGQPLGIRTMPTWHYQWKYVLPPVLGTWRKKSKSCNLRVSPLICGSNEDNAHFFTTLSQCPKSLLEAFTSTGTRTMLRKPVRKQQSRKD